MVYICLAVLAREQGETEVSTEGMDDCGLRYMLAARHHVYLLNTLTFVQRAQLQKNGLNPSVLIWAFHSESVEELLNLIPSVQKGEPTWTELRQFGVGWWVRNINSLRRCIEKVRRSTCDTKYSFSISVLIYSKNQP